MVKIIALTLSLLFVCVFPPAEVPASSQGIPEQGVTSVESRGDILIYTDTIESDDGHTSVSVTYSIDKKSNQIIEVQSVSNVKALDKNYINPGLPSIYLQSVSMDKQSVDFRIQFYAKTKDDNISGIRYANFRINLNEYICLTKPDSSQNVKEL